MKDPNWRKCLLLGDSKDVIKRIPNNSIDFIFTDPPYNIGQHSTGNIPLPGRTAMNNDVADWDQIDFNPEEWADEFIRILKPTGNLFIFTSYNQLGRWYNCLDKKFDTTNFMIWHKTNPAPKIFKAGFLNSCEMIFTCWNKKHTWNFTTQAEMHNFVESSICMRPERLSNPKHPAQKPVQILEKIIKIASNENDIVFDPFMGVGSTGVAAIKLGRKFIGVEIDKSYYEAASRRVNEELANYLEKNTIIHHPIKYNMEEQDENIATVHDTEIQLYNPFISTPEWYEEKPKPTVKKYIFAISPLNKKLKPLLKWPGGKEKELPYIISNAPLKFENYYEPFVGGGSVFTAFDAKKYYINDKSTELIRLYRYIATRDELFFGWLDSITHAWSNVLDFVENNRHLCDFYKRFRNDEVDEKGVKQEFENFVHTKMDEINAILPSDFVWQRDAFATEVEKCLVHKFKRMKKIESESKTMPEKDIFDNIETSFTSALYTYLRALYNDKTLKTYPELSTSLFVFLRNYAYSGMFRYNDNGDFNVPYGGISYNHKTMNSKTEYYHSAELLRLFEKTTIENLDFEDFFNKHQPTDRDFVFLDPPYDSEFSTYTQNEFTKEDQKRLADYLCNRCQAKWQLVIKYTPYIHSLYDRDGIIIKKFDKKYVVSFMNRNDKDAEHLIITNYQPRSVNA